MPKQSIWRVHTTFERMKIAHLIHPITPAPGSDLLIAQPVTFESMKHAAAYARGSVEVELMASGFAEDEAYFPAGFTRTRDLERSVLDLGEFAVPRRLPLLVDLLDRAYHGTNADFVIYSNVDITLMPYFYLTVSRWLESDEALIINRRNISDVYTEPAEFPQMYAELGSRHPGFDCFVLPRSRIPNLDVGNVCIGTNRIGMVFALALHCTSKSLRLFADSHMTFHIGQARGWINPKLQDYVEHNKREAIKVIKRLETQYGPFDESLPSWGYKAVIDLDQNLIRRSFRLTRYYLRQYGVLR